MDSKVIYSSKAAKYAKYRWDYAHPAVQAILDTAGINHDSAVADIGAGTGILTRHFVTKAGQVIGIEPNAEMRKEAEALLAAYPSCRMIDACAESTGLPDHSVDLITAAHAIHWFDPVPARRELFRILKPNGWLAILTNDATQHAINEAIGQISTPENGVNFEVVEQRPEPKPAAFYFGSGSIKQQAFPFSFEQDFDSFLGAMMSASYMPDETNPCYPKLEKEAREVFSRFSAQGKIQVTGNTVLLIGQPAA